MDEVWKDITGFAGYEVSSHGRVRSWKTGEARYIFIDWSGRDHKKYHSVRLYDGLGTRKKFVIHRLMWIVFNGPIPEGYQIDHIDRNNTNNMLSNLRCVTVSENQLNKEPWDEDPVVRDCFGDIQ